MKKFVKFLAVIFAIFYAISCEYDDKFIIEEKDGFSTVVKIDTVYSSSGNSGIQISNFLDIDYSNSYTPGDIFQNSYTVWNGLNGTNGLDARVEITRLEPNSDCAIGSLLIQSYSGNNLISSLTFCLPANGSDGFSPVMKVDSYCEGELTGNLLSFFLDLDRNNKVSVGDSYMGGFIVFNGKDGADGQNGESPKVTFNVVQSNCESGKSLVITSSLGGKVISTTSFCIPRDGIDGQNGQDGVDGQNGYSPVIKSCPYYNSYRETIGQVVSFYWDRDRNGVYSSGDKYLNSILILNGEDGKPASALVCLTLEYDFQGAKATYFSSTGFVLNGFLFSEADGALYLHSSCGSLLFPPFIDNVDLLSLVFNYGSKNSYDIVVKAVYADKTEEVIEEFHLEGNPNFQKNTYSTYSLFQYHANLEDIKFKNIKQIKVEVERDGSKKCVPEDFYIDQVIINLLDRNH